MIQIHVEPTTPALPREEARMHADPVLFALPLPLMILLADRRVVFCNEAARLLTAEKLGQVQSNQLMSLGQLDTARLGELVSMAASGSGSRTGLWFTPSLATGWLHLAPLASGAAQVSGCPPRSVMLAVHLDQPALTQAARIDALAGRFQLTRAERHVLLLLADGEPVQAASRHLGLAVSTVRSHVRNLLGKTQAASLMQLLRWTGSAAPLPH